MAKTIFVSENCQYTVDPSKIRSAVNPGTELENGSAVTLSGLATGERELWTAAVATAATANADIWVVTTPEVAYDETPYVGLGGFYNGINDEGTKKTPMRVVKLVKGDIFGLTVGGALATAPTTAKPYITTGAGGTWGIDESTGSKNFAKWIDTRVQNGTTVYTFEVL